MHQRSLRDCAPRYRLLTLGRLTLISPDGIEDPSLGTRRRKLAVLAYVALWPRPVTRDHLASVFWGGKDDARARNSLSDAISHLRRVLGRHAIVTKGDEVALADDAALLVDAIELRAAVQAEDWPKATALYAGPFLEGVHVEDAAEFDRWSATEAVRLRRLFSRACAPYALSLAERRQWDACSELAARWLEADPTSADAILCRLNALRAPQTQAASLSTLAEYDRLRALLTEELGVGMDPAVERLVASIREELPPVVAAPTPSAPATETPQSLVHSVEEEVVWRPDTGARSRRAGKRTLLVASLAVAALGVAGLLLQLQRTDRVAGAMSAHGADTRPVLAVLPFENLGATSDSYFAEGLSDEVRARLTNIPGLRVIGGSSVYAYARTTKAPREIARELGATHLLTGSVRWEHAPSGKQRVRVSPVLVRAADQSDMWAESVDRTLDDVFAIQADVAERVATALDARLRVRDRREVPARPTTNLAAYDAYLRGRAAVSSATTFSAADRRTIRTEFERAVSLDRGFAAAHTQLAWSHFRDYTQAGNADDKSAALMKFRVEARLAWSLDSADIGTRLVHARDLELAGDREGAERLVRETARMAPDNVEALAKLADVEWWSGRYEAALAANRRGMALDPLAANAWNSLAGNLDRLYRYEEAISVREREIEVTPNSDVAYAVQASSQLLWRADTAAARQTLERGSVTLPWVVRLPGGVAGIAIWKHALPSSVTSARDTLTLAGYLSGPGGIAPELYHLLMLRHFAWSGRMDRARHHADSLVARLAPGLVGHADAPWFFWWFSRRSLLAEAYATLGRTADAAREADVYVAETRRRIGVVTRDPEQLCHALHNAAYVDVLIGRTSVATARLTEALALPCGHRVSRTLLRADSAWAPLWTLPAFQQLVANGS